MATFTVCEYVGSSIAETFSNFADAKNRADYYNSHYSVHYKVFNSSNVQVYPVTNYYYVGPATDNITNVETDFSNAMTISDAHTTSGTTYYVFDSNGTIMYPVYRSSNYFLYHHSGECENERLLNIWYSAYLGYFNRLNNIYHEIPGAISEIESIKNTLDEE